MLPHSGRRWRALRIIWLEANTGNVQVQSHQKDSCARREQDRSTARPFVPERDFPFSMHMTPRGSHRAVPISRHYSQQHLLPSPAYTTGRWMLEHPRFTAILQSAAIAHVMPGNAAAATMHRRIVKIRRKEKKYKCGGERGLKGWRRVFLIEKRRGV